MASSKLGILGWTPAVALLVLVGLGCAPEKGPDPQQADLPIRIVFLFLSPDDPKFFGANLQLLRRIAIVFQPALIDQLLQAKTPQIGRAHV